MNKAFEKILERLEERTSFLSDCTKYGNKDAEQQNKSYSTMMMYEVSDLVDDLIEIVKQESEKYNNGWIPCSERLPEEYTVLCCDKYGEMIIGHPYFDEVSDTNYSSESDNEMMYNCVAWQPLPQPYQPKGE